MSSKFIVITKTSVPNSKKEELLDLIQNSFQIFIQQKGLLNYQTYLAHDESHTLTIMEWDSKENHEACMKSPDFESFNPRWERLLSAQDTSFELNTYQVYK